MGNKYVYYFGDGKADGKADMKGLLGGKGANLAEMTNIGLACAPRIHNIDGSLHLLLCQQEKISQGTFETSGTGASQTREISGHEIWQCEKSFAHFCPVRSPRLDARHDGYHSESWVE